MDAQTWLDNWAASVPELERVEAGFWRARRDGDVSYPEGGHFALAAVEEQSRWFAHRNEVIVDLVRRYPPTGVLLDVGGGTGFVALALNRAGFPAALMEPGARGVASARVRAIPTVEAAYQSLSVPAASLPAVGMFDVLEHIEDDVAALSSIFRALAPGGRLYLAVPALQALWSAEDVYAGHFRRYSRSLLIERVAAAGFLVEFASCFFGALTAPVFALRALPSRLGMSARSHDTSAVKQDHSLGGAMVGAVLKQQFSAELSALSAGQVSRIGTSCVLAARKPD